MKFFLPVMCSLLLIGCSDSAKTSTPAETTTAPAESSAVSKALSAAPAANMTEKTNSSSTQVVSAMTTAAVDGGVLFAQKCAACHGSKAEKSALNKSQIISGFSEQQIKDALHGYQAGTYGKEMKAMMQGQAKPLSNEQIDALAKYISNL